MAAWKMDQLQTGLRKRLVRRGSVGLLLSIAAMSAPAQRSALHAAATESRAQAASTLPHRDSLFSGYSAVSPHWPHIRTMMTDFYYKWTPAERSWAGRHYDFAMSGNLSAWKSANPTVQHYEYALLQATVLPKVAGKGDLQSGWSRDVATWYAAHPEYTLERGFLHQAGQPADSAHRLKPWGWATPTWIINPADPGMIAYSRDRLKRAVGKEDGIFLDSQGSGALIKNIKGAAEYTTDAKWPPESTPYFVAYGRLLAAIKGDFGSKVVMLNTGPYKFTPDSVNVVAAGSTHMEKTNDPLSTDLPATWAWIDRMLKWGVFVDFVNTRDYADMDGTVKRGYGDGKEVAYRKLKLSELASYYMVVPPSPDRLALQLVSMWDRPYPPLWLKAQEANIGHPVGARKQITQGIATTDRVGQPTKVYQREFDRALVLFRAQTGWGAQIYGDTTDISIPLPPGETWLPLHADGTLGGAITAEQLGNAEGAIMIRGSSLP